MDNRALSVLASVTEMPNERRLTLYLFGSVYFALGKIESGKGVTRRLLQSYHGRAICAQHINDSAGALRWSEQTALLALERRICMKYYV